MLRDIALAEVDEGLVDQASDLATTVVLRGYDAVHLASLECVESGESVLVAADGDLARAGQRWDTQSPCRPGA